MVEFSSFGNWEPCTVVIICTLNCLGHVMDNHLCFMPYNQFKLMLFFSLFSACTSTESGKTQCLNGGVCFAIEVGTDRTAACNCQDGFAGTKCQSRAIDPAIIG